MTNQERLEMLRKAATDLRELARNQPQHHAKLLELAEKFETEADELEWRLKTGH